MKSNCWLATAGLIAALETLSASAQTAKQGSFVTESLISENLRDTRVGVDPRRSILVYLPPDYARNTVKSYPVIYYFHSISSSTARLFADVNAQNLFDRAIAEGVVREFILVAADYSSPAGCFFENSSTTGHWLDFTVKELVPFVDGHFRTIPQRDSRALAGDGMGGYGALKFAMLYPELFSVVYALHPVATGTGLVPMADRADWRRIHQAKSYKDLEDDGFSRLFLAMSQAYLPNPDRPPFYCDFMVELENGELKQSVENTKKLQSRFLLDHLLVDNAGHLREMRGIKFDWGRYDSNQDHVYANQAFTRKLDELGIEHEAEEYRGNAWNRNWTDDGRVYGDLLPFFNRHLVFQKDHQE